MNELNKINDLLVPENFSNPIKLFLEHADLYHKWYSDMLKIRAVERKLAEQRKNGVIGGPVHLGVGQEAIAVGVSHSLKKTDRVFGAHRSHSHVLALGADVRSLFAEVLGKDTGLSRGMGGSMHLWDKPNGFYGSVPIVSGTVPLAVGAALAGKMQKNESVAVAYIGDGAMEEGVVHESLNLASTMQLPIIFIIENNLFSSHMHISLRQPNAATARFAHANHIKYKIIDGNDIAQVQEVAKKFIFAAREGAGPAFIEAVTFRWYGHVDWREDIDVGVNRSQKDLQAWRARCPIERLEKAMIKEGLLDEQKAQTIKSNIMNIIEEAWAVALKDPYPEADSLMSRVYKGRQ